MYLFQKIILQMVFFQNKFIKFAEVILNKKIENYEMPKMRFRKC